MRGRLVVIALALVAIVVAFSARGGSDDKGGARTTSGASADGPNAQLASLRRLDREGGAHQAPRRRLQPCARPVRRAGRGGPRFERGLRRRRDPDRRRAHCARRCGRPRPRSGAGCSTTRPTAAGRRREPVDRAHAARDRDVGADGARPGLPEAAARLRASILRLAHRAAGPRRQAAVRALQARAHQPGLLDRRAVGGRRRVLRGDRQARGPDRGRRQARGARAGQAARALDRPLRRHDAVHRRPDAPATGWATRRRWRWRRPRCIDFNRRAAPASSSSRVYPKEGTFFSDNPLITLRATG